jgi:hypothetical protein
MPILGVIASSYYNNPAPVDDGVMFPIGLIQVGSGGVANIEFTGIPNTYKSLQLRIYGKNQRTTYSIAEFQVQFNGDTSNNYAGKYLTGSGNSTTVYASAIINQPRFQIVGMGSSLNNQFGVGILDIVDYAASTKYKTTKILSGLMSDVAGASGYYGQVGICSGLWMSNSPITSIKITSEDAVNMAQYSSFALYGIKG